MLLSGNGNGNGCNSNENEYLYSWLSLGFVLAALIIIIVLVFLNEIRYQITGFYKRKTIQELTIIGENQQGFGGTGSI